ncbi:MAG: hypothetical protein ABJB95_08800, partial [Gemmatimonadales bacterium]
MAELRIVFCSPSTVSIITPPELAVRGVGHHDPTLLVDNRYSDLQGIEHLLELAIGPMSLGQTGHGADDPDRSSGLIAGYVGAVLNHRIRAIRPAEAVFVGPDVPTLGYRGIEARCDALPVSRVEPVVPPRSGIAQIGPLVVEQGPGSFVPDQPIGYQIPIPDRLIRGPGEETVALLAFSKCGLGVPSLGDLLDGGDEMARLAFGTGHQRDVHQGPHDLARRPDKPLLHGVGPALPGQQQPESLPVGRHVVRVGSGFDGKTDQILPGHIQDLTDCPVHPQPAAIGRDKRHPGARVLEGIVELLLTFPAPVLSLPALGDLGAQLDLGGRRSRQVPKERNVPFRPEPGSLIDDAQGSDGVTLAGDQRHPGIRHPPELPDDR